MKRLAEATLKCEPYDRTMYNLNADKMEKGVVDGFVVILTKDQPPKGTVCKALAEGHYLVVLEDFHAAGEVAQI